MKEVVALELHNTNPTIPLKDFISLINSSEVWEFNWGIIFARGNDIHIHILKDKQKRAFIRGALRQVAKTLFSRYDKITTSILKDKPKALEFDLKIGWKLVSENNISWYLEMTKEDFKYV